MAPPPLPANEAERLALIDDLRLVEIVPTLDLKRLTRLVRAALGTDMCDIGIVGRDEVHCRSGSGETYERLPRASAICAWAILGDAPIWSDDPTRDPRMAGSPYGAGARPLRFCAAAPIVLRGQRVGALVVGAHAQRTMTAALGATLIEAATLIADEFELHLARVQMEQALERLTAQNADLLETRRAAEAANRAKSEFLANMGHEIRTPLNGVVGMAGVLAQTPLDPNQKQMAAVIESSARALNSLMGDILELSSIEAGRLQLDPQPFNLEETAGTLKRRFASEIAAKGLAFEVHVSSRAGRVEVMGDALRIRQAIGKLLSNAVKFTSQGVVTLSVDLGAEGGAVFTVADTGAGFDDADKARLFDRFSQGDGSLTRRHDGAGMGLAICRSLVEAMGGAVEAEGRPGQGATFRVVLPLAVCAAETVCGVAA